MSTTEYVLDCGSGELALQSVAKLFNCTEEELTTTLMSIDIDALYEKHFYEIDIPADQYLYEYVVEKLGEPNQLTEVMWFHGTRTIKNNRLEDGIYPLNKALDIVWNSLIESAPDNTVRDNLNDLRVNGVGDHLYSLRTEGDIHWGPYGILVREVAFHTERLHQHDYLGMPEIVEDIINGYRAKFNVCLTEHYTSALVPALVKFKSSDSLHQGCIEAALGYLYSHVRSSEIRSFAVICIDKKGKEIDAEEIVEVEYF